MEDLVKKFKIEPSVGNEEKVIKEELNIVDNAFVNVDVNDVLEHYQKKTRSEMDELMKFMRM